MNDSLGDNMKHYEKNSLQNSQADSDENLYVRVDGRHFSTFVRKLPALIKPFDERVLGAMIFATQITAKDLHAKFAYCQSDEASFGWPRHLNPLSQHPFDGKFQKLTTVSASLFAVAFFRYLSKQIWADEIPNLSFDGRAVRFGTHEYSDGDFQKMFYWRYLDAKRNAISGFSRKHWSQKQLHGSKTYQLLEMITDNDAICEEWNNTSDLFKEGVFFIDGEIVAKEEFKNEFAAIGKSVPL